MHEQAHLRPFEEVKGQLIAEYTQRTQAAQMQNLADKAVAELHKDPLHPEKAAEAVGTTVVQVENFQAGDPIPGIGVSKEIGDAVAPLHKGEITAGPIVLPGNKVVLASVTDYQPAHQASLDEAKADVRNKASQDKLQEILSKKAAELFAKAQAMGGDLAKAAKEMGVEVKTSPDVDRSAAIEGVGSASSLPDAFTKPVGTLIGPVAVPGGRVIAKIDAQVPADLSQLPVQTATIREQLKQQKIKDRTAIFEVGLKKALEADCSVWGWLTSRWRGGCPVLKVHQDVLTRLIQTYTSRS